jgi:hypothetical protein
MAKKNQKYRKQRQSRKFPWLFVVLGGGLLLLAAVLFANRSVETGGSPALAVDQNKIDYGNVKFGQTRQFAFKITNTGDGALRFSEDPYIEVVEGC